MGTAAAIKLFGLRDGRRGGGERHLTWQRSRVLLLISDRHGRRPQQMLAAVQRMSLDRRLCRELRAIVSVREATAYAVHEHRQERRTGNGKKTARSRMFWRTNPIDAGHSTSRRAWTVDDVAIVGACPSAGTATDRVRL